MTSSTKTKAPEQIFRSGAFNLELYWKLFR